MDIDELKSIIRRELDTSLGIEGSRLSAERRRNLEYYDGEPFGDEVEGRSSVVMLSVMETVEWVLPAILRIFCSSDKLCEYEPAHGSRDPEKMAMMEAAAEQATNYTSHIVYRDNNGFIALHDWFKDAILQKVGWIKVFWDNQRVLQTNTYTGLSEEEYQALIADHATTVVEKKVYPAPPADGFNEDAPNPGQAMLYDCTIRVARTEGRVKIEPVPPEEVLTSRRAKGAHNLPFVCHRVKRTVTDLIEQGYDREQAARLETFDEQEYNTERVVRYEKEDDFPYETERQDPPMRAVWIEENYLRVDWDGDGLAELRKVVTAGSSREILIKAKPDGEPYKEGEPFDYDNEEVDEVPLIPITPIRMPHKLVGVAVADLVMDLQLIRSVLMRQMLDNLYLTNAPRMAIEEGAAGENTYEDLLTVRSGGIIRTVRNAGLMPLGVPFVAEKAFPMLQYLDQVSEARTGVAPHNQSIDSDVINKSSSGLQTHLMQQAAAQRVELIARVFAETGVKELCRRILGLVTRYQQVERIIRVTGDWVAMDPRQWRDQMNVSVSVGLGSGNSDQVLSHLMQILQVQQNIIMVQKGIQGPLVTAKNVFDVLEQLTEKAGFKQAFFTDPAAASQPGQPGGGPSQPPPDPEVMKAQQEMQIQQARMQTDLQIQQAKSQQEMQIAQQKAQLNSQLEQQKAAHAMQLEQFRVQSQHELALQEMAAKERAGAYAPPPAPVNGTGAA